MTDRYSTSPIEIEDTDPPHYGRDWQADRMPGRFANVSIVGASLASETGVRAAVAKLTAWLDAPRLAAREKPEVVARAGWKYGKCGIELLCTEFGEHSVRKDDGGYLMGWTLTRDAEWLFQSIRKENRS